MYGFHGMYGNAYGITVTGYRAGVRPLMTTAALVPVQRGNYRVTLAVDDGVFVYERQAPGEWKIVDGPRFVGMFVSPGVDFELLQRLEQAYKDGIRDISSRRRSPSSDVEVDEETESAGISWAPIAGGIVLAGALAGAIYLLRRKK